MGINVTRTFEKEEILPFVKESFFDVVEDNTTIEKIESYVDVNSDCWVRIVFDGKTIGVVQFKPYNRSTVEIHPFIGKENRNKSEIAVKNSINWFELNSPNMYQSLITNIATCNRYATLFALKMGFKKIGCYKDSFCRKNQMYDIELFQRSRKQWAE